MASTGKRSRLRVVNKEVPMVPIVGIAAIGAYSGLLVGVSSRVLKTSFVDCKENARSPSTWAWHAAFCLSSYLLVLMISEFFTFLSTETKYVLWHCGLWALSIHMVMVIPALLVLHLAQRSGLHPKKQVVVTAALLVAWLVAFLHIKDWIASYHRPNKPSTRYYYYYLLQNATVLLDLEAYIARIDVLGVILFALLSGFAAVNFPFTNLAPGYPVSAAAIHSQEKRTKQTLKSAEIKRAQLEALRTKQPEAPTSAGGGRSLWGINRLFRRRTDAAATQAQALQMELEVLDGVGRELLLELEEMKRIEERVEMSKTFMGRMKRRLSMFLAVYCLYRIFWSAVITFTSHELSQEDIVSKGFRLALHTLSVPVSTAWIPLVSFLFVGCLTVLQMRRFFLLFMRVSRLPMSLVDTDLQILLTAFLMGAYFVSCVTLMRTNLPPGFREGVTSALGDIEYDFFRREFSLIFFWSACATVVLLLVTQRISKSKTVLSTRDDDGHFYQDLDDHNDEGKRAADDNV